MPVNGITYSHRIATADVDSTDVTRSGGDDNYALVDDGFATINLTDYIQLGTSTGAASFSATGSVADGVTYLSVEVVAECQGVSGEGELKLYLVNGSVDDDGSAQACASTAWAEYSEAWDANPFTSSAWTRAAINDLEFGIKSTGASYAVKCCRIYLRAKYRKAADDEWFATEIHELQSADGGATWAFAAEHSRNSSVGVPIMTQKHHLKNDVIEVGWCSGNDLFWLMPPDYGKIAKSAEDCRIFWGSFELHRVIDYANLDLSTIRFKLPQALAKHGTALTRPLYVYYGNVEPPTTPLADPNEVYLYFENFEDYAEVSDLDGQGGWVATNMTSSIHVSPPEGNPLVDGHSNKIFAGGRSCLCSGSEGTPKFVKELGSALTNIYIEVAIWPVGSSAVPMIAAVDADGDSFGAGHTDASPVDKAGYAVNGTVTASSLNSIVANYNEYALQVTDAGCSAWFNGELIADEVAAITSIDDLLMTTPPGSSAYFDFIRVSRLLHRSANETVTSLTDNSMAVTEATPSSAYSAAKAKHNFTSHREIEKLEISVTATAAGCTYADFGIYISNADTYDNADLDRSITGARIQISSGTGTKKFILDASAADSIDNSTNGDSTYNMPTIGDKSVMAELYDTDQEFVGTATITSIKVYYKEQDPAIVLGDEEYRGMMFDATIQASDTRLVTLDATISGYRARLRPRLPVELAGSVVARPVSPREYLASLATAPRLPIELAAEMAAATSRIPIEYLAGLASDHRLPTDYSGWLRGVCRLPMDYAGRFTTDHRLPIGYGQTFAHANRLPVEYLAGLAAATRLPLEYLLATAAGTHLPVEILSQLAIGTVLPVDYGLDFGVASVLPIELLGTAALAPHIPIGYRGYLVAGQRLPMEILAPSVFAASLAIEYGSTFAAIHRTPVEHLVSLAADFSLLIGYAGLTAWSFRLPMDIQVSAYYSGRWPIDYGVSASSRHTTPVEVLSGLALRPTLPTDFGVSVAGGQILPMELLVSTLGQHHLPLELLAQMSIDADLPIEWLSGTRVTTPAHLPLEWLAPLTQRAILPLGYSGWTTVAPRLPVEHRGVLQLSAILPIDYGIGLTSRGTVPIEYLLAMALAGRIPIEIIAALVLAARRAVTIAGENRIIPIAADNRLLTVPGEIRTLTIPEDKRTIYISPENREARQ